MQFESAVRTGANPEPVMPAYVRVYGIVLAGLEILSGILILMRVRLSVSFAYIVFAISIIGCLVAIIAGDVVAVVSLFMRMIAVWIVAKAKMIIFKTSVNNKA